MKNTFKFLFLLYVAVAPVTYIITKLGDFFIYEDYDFLILNFFIVLSIWIYNAKLAPYMQNNNNGKKSNTILTLLIILLLLTIQSSASTAKDTISTVESAIYDIDSDVSGVTEKITEMASEIELIQLELSEIESKCR